MTTVVQEPLESSAPNVTVAVDASAAPAPRAKVEAGVKLRGAEKVARIPVKIIPTEELPKKPDWIRVRIPVSPEVDRIKQLLRKHKLHSVCEEASCPNLGECFSGGTATFMIMGDICTRRCPFCDVGHGRPNHKRVFIGYASVDYPACLRNAAATDKRHPAYQKGHKHQNPPKQQKQEYMPIPGRAGCEKVAADM